MSKRNISGYVSQPGDIIIGATFPIHVERMYSEPVFTMNPPDLHCKMLEFQNYQSMHALIFAVEEINSNDHLLPNITLGVQIIDTCTTLRRAAEGTFWMLSGGLENVPNYDCRKESLLAGIVGDSGSTRSILMAQILGLYRYPQISYFSTSPLLSSRNLFPSFFRTIPSDEFQLKGLSQLISYFGWSWVGLLATDNDYGQFGIQVVKNEIMKAGACVAFIENIVTGRPNRNAIHIVQVIRESTAMVIAVVSSDLDFLPVVEQLLMQNVTGKTWIASESWSTSDLLSKERYVEILAGTIGFAVSGGQMSGFSEYLNSLHPSKDQFDSFLREFWEQTFSCKWLMGDKMFKGIEENTTSCTGMENLQSIMNEADTRITLNVYTSVYAFAWALEALKNCKLTTGPFYNGTCANISSFHPWQLLHYIKTIHFQIKDGTQVFFDMKGNPPATYDVVNWQVRFIDTLKQVNVGSYDSSVPDGKTLQVNITSIVWPKPNTQIPLSQCSSSCPPGFQKVTLLRKPTCCFECFLCPQGQMSNQTDSTECWECSWNTWPNLRQNQCVPRTIEFLSYEQPLGSCLAAISVSSSVIPLGILIIFIHYRNTPIVRANNHFLSCFLLISLSFCFLCSLVFIGFPNPAKCLLRQVAFGLIFASCISCVLAKTIIVVIAFTATKPGSSLRKLTGVKVSYYVIVLGLLFQICVCVIWLSTSPPFPEYDTQTKPGIIIVNCNEGGVTAFWCMLGYLGLLSTISFIAAFMSRRLPDHFNEAKFITFSMLAFLIVWITFIPAYLSASGKYTVSMEIFAILSSSWAVVLCIFLPKCFIILFQPNMNSREHILRKNNTKY